MPLATTSPTSLAMDVCCLFPMVRTPTVRTGRVLLTALLAVFLLAILPTAAAQGSAYEPEFFAETMVVPDADADQGRLDLYAAAPYRNLRFLSRDEGFVATYTITADIYRTDAAGNARTLVESRQWDRRVAVPVYEGTQADSLLDYTTQSLALPAGPYLVELQLEDGSSRRTFVREIAVEVPDYDRGIALAGPLLLDEYDPQGQTIVPNVANVVYMDREALSVLYEVYSDRARRLSIGYEVVEVARTRDLPSARNVARGLLGLDTSDADEEARGVVTEATTQIDVQAGSSPATLAILLEDLKAGSYRLVVTLADTDGTVLATAAKPFDVRWTGLAAQIEDLDAAIAQLRYVAKDRDVRDIQEAASQDERLRRFVAFWERRDPTPGTRRNERMEEYYYRVFYANENYGRFSESGWNTDRGEVFVRFGEPDFVEQHTFNYSVEPYEIWYYNRLGRRFIFVDEKGFGNYQLLYPIHDDRTRM